MPPTKPISNEYLLAKLERLEEILIEMKETQRAAVAECTELRDEINRLDLLNAQYPNPDEVSKYFKRIDYHDTILGIMIAAVVFVVTWVSGVLKSLLGF